MDAINPDQTVPKVATPHIATLSGTPLFGGVKPEVLAELLKECRLIHKEPGEYFFREGEEGQSMYLLERGEVALLKDWQGRQYRLRCLGEGACFGEIALVDFCPRGASVMALKPCDVVEIPIGCLQRLYEIDPEQYTLVQMNLARELSRRLREADLRLFRQHVQGLADDDLDGLCAG